MGGEGSGHHLEPVIRRLIFHYYKNYNKTPAEIYEILFNDCSAPHVITLKYLHDLCRRFDQAEPADLEDYLTGVREQGRRMGRRTYSLGQEDKVHLRSILRERGTRRLQEIANELYLRIDDEMGHINSVPTIHRALHSMEVTRKVFNFTIVKLEYH
jgi:hypothetical protein